jgi:hypothetical protein
MPNRLRVYSPFPPGEFPYRQTQGIDQYFAGDGLSIEQQAGRVLDFRRGNQLERRTLIECVEDIDAYTCARLNNNPTFVVDTEAPIVLDGRPQGGCATCGTPVAP